LENKFSRHFFFAYGRKKKCGCPYGLAEKKKENSHRGLREHRELNFKVTKQGKTATSFLLAFLSQHHHTEAEQSKQNSKSEARNPNPSTVRDRPIRQAQGRPNSNDQKIKTNDRKTDARPIDFFRYRLHR